MIDQAGLKDLLSYDPEQGLFVWKAGRSNVRAGSRAGALGSHGYWEIRINRKLYLAHRLAWLYTFGKWPEQIDHINCDRIDNRISNLRLASYSDNNRNVRRRANNTSGFKGVSRNVKLARWQAHIQVDGHNKYLGLFDTPELAHEAYCKVAKAAFGPFFNPGTA